MGITRTFCLLMLALPLSAVAARIDLDPASVAEMGNGKPIFSDLFCEPRHLKQDFTKTQDSLKAFYARRAEFVTKLGAETEARLAKLQEENRRLMLTRGDNGEDTGPDSKWALALYDNIAEQATIRQSYLDELAAWDVKNWVEVDITRDGEKQYLSSVRIHRQGETPTAIAAE